MGFSGSLGGGSSSSNSYSRNSREYSDTTTTNPYMTSRTTNKGTTTTFAPGTSLETIYNFTNKNIDQLLNEYLNPSLDTAQNQAKMNQFNKLQTQNLYNNVISPLSTRNMLRSSQATNLYKNLSNQSADYANSLLADSQNNNANVINNLMNLVMQGWNAANGNQAQSLNTSSGNATSTTVGNNNSNSTSWGFAK